MSRRREGRERRNIGGGGRERKQRWQLGSLAGGQRVMFKLLCEQPCICLKRQRTSLLECKAFTILYSCSELTHFQLTQQRYYTTAM